MNSNSYKSKIYYFGGIYCDKEEKVYIFNKSAANLAH